MVRYRALGCLLVPFLMAGMAMAQTAHHKPIAGSTAAESSGYKAIFEPVNYGQDINFTDVFFVSPEVGWVAGEHATILKTTDGGSHWTAQVGGDPSGNEKPIGQLRFLDARHGWAVSNEGPQRLLRTVDGENWEQIGEQPAPGSGFDDYAFTSVRHGIALGGNMGGFYVTEDGGAHWRNVGPCSFRVTVQGLPQTFDCHFIKLQMLSTRVGYAFTSWRSPEAPNSTTVVLFRTDDAGEHWNYNVTSARGGRPDGYFLDAEHGVLVFQDKTYITNDGGKNWRALLSGGVITDTVDSHVRFADPEVGWSLGDKYPVLALSYTADGGQHWKTLAPFKLPTDPNAKLLSLSFPRRDRAYIAGPHGMVYRYRIVPANYTAANSLAGPMMPAFDLTPVTAASARISSDLQKLRAKLAAAGAPESPANAPQGQAASSNAPSDTGGGFVQDVDSSPPSPALQNCCAAPLQEFQADLSSFNQVAPATATKYRNVNLAIAGFQLVASLANHTSALRQSFASLKHASTLQAASAILQQLTSAVTSVQQTVSSGFQDTGAWYANAAGSGDFTQGATDSSPASGSSTPGQPGGFQQDVPAAPANPAATQAGAPPQLQAQQPKRKSKWHMPDLNKVPLPR